MKLRRTAFLSMALLIAAMGPAREAFGGASRSLAVIAGAYKPGIPVFVRVEVRNVDGTIARDLWDAQATLAGTAGGAPVAFSSTTVVLRNGMGSTIVNVQPPYPDQDIQLTASMGEAQAVRTLKNVGGLAVTKVPGGSLAASLTEWSGVVQVTGNLTVPAGKTLRLLPGAMVLIDGVQTDAAGYSIDVNGTFESLGTEEEPVTITASTAGRPWGEIHHDGASPSLYQHTIVTRGGNSPRGGHTGTGPAVHATNSKIVFLQSSISDTKGKTMEASGSDLEFQRCLIARSVMGPEIDGTAILFQDSWGMEMRGTDDNDAIYIHSQKTGQRCTLLGSVFADCDDDGIDTLGSVVEVKDCIIRDFHGLDQDAKGISVLMGEVKVERCLLVDNLVGISAKGSGSTGATVRIGRTTVIGTDRQSPNGSQVGIQAQDKYGLPELRILFFVNDSIVRAPIAVRTDYPKFPDDIQIRYSDLSSPWPGTFNVGNITLDPLFVDAGADDYRLGQGSPCIDSGDPASDLDPDGTRADMGAFWFDGSPAPAIVRGRVNGDTLLDISDPIALLFHLFVAESISCLEAADATDDGAVDIADVIRLLDHLFLGGAELPPPAAACAPDPTSDGLGCLTPACP